MAINDSKASKIPLDVSINCDPVSENVWPFIEDTTGESIADQQLISNTGYHFEGGISTLKQVQTSNGNSPVYSYVTENGNVIDLRSAGNDATSGAPMNGVYLDGKFLDYVPAHGLESMQSIGGSYDDLCLTDGNPIGVKVKSNSATTTPVYGTGGSSWTAGVTSLASTGVMAGPAYFVNFGSSVSSGFLYHSTDGSGWSPSSGSWNAGLYTCGAYGGGVYVVLGSGVGVYSLDGTSWSKITSLGGSVSIKCVAYGGGYFVAASDAFSNSTAYYSTDGINWLTSTMPVSGAWKGIAFDGTAFLLTSSTGTIMCYGTPSSWSSKTAPSSASWKIASSGTGKFCIVSGSSFAYTTNSASSWTTGTLPSGGASDITFGNGVLVVVGGTNVSFYSSNDGATWASGVMASTYLGVCYGSGRFVSTRSSGVASYSLPSVSSQLILTVDEISSTGSVVNTVSRTISGAGYSKPVTLVKQALGNSFTWASTQYFLAADSATTYNIFDQSGVKQLTTSIPVAWASGAPKYVWSCKFYNKNDYFVCALGAAGTVANPSSYMITSTGGSAPYTNTNNAATYSWAVMQSRKGYNRVIASGQYNTNPATTANLINFLGYFDFTASYTGSTIPSNSVTNTLDLTAQPAASTYAYVDLVHTDYHHYYSGYDSPGSLTTLFTDTPNSSGSLNGYGRLSFANTTDFGGKNPFEFRLNVFKNYGTGSTTYPESPQFVSVGSPYGKDGKCAIGVPLSAVGEFDPSFGPQIGANWDTVCWRWNQVYYIAKISTSPNKPIQKITSNLYKINSISPINVVNVASKSLVLGSNDYTSSFIMTGGTLSGTSFGSANIAWNNQSQTAANSIDLGGVAFFNTGSPTPAPLSAFIPTIHQGSAYYFVNFYSGTAATPATITLNSVWRADGQAVTGTSLLTGFQNQLSALGTTYIANTALVPLPLGVRYQGYTIGTNSSATSSAFGETYLTAGYQGTTLTSEWDGYILGNQLAMNSVSFALFNVPYLFDGKYIYRLTINNGGVQVPLTTMARADGLVYMTTSSNVAFFFDPFDNSIWAFDGGATLSKIKRLDGFGAIQNGNFSPYENTLLVNTENSLVTMRDGIWSAIPKSALMTPDGLESSMRLYDTTVGTVFGNSFNWWRYQYYNPDATGVTTPITGFTQTVSTVGLNIQTGFIGPNTNRRMVLNAVVFEVYNSARTQTDLNVTIYGYDQDGSYTQQIQKISVPPSKWVLGGMYRHRVQPKNDRILAASFQLQCSTPVRLYGLSYHWMPEVQAINQGNQSS